MAVQSASDKSALQCVVSGLAFLGTRCLRDKVLKQDVCLAKAVLQAQMPLVCFVHGQAQPQWRPHALPTWGSKTCEENSPIILLHARWAAICTPYVYCATQLLSQHGQMFAASFKDAMNTSLTMPVVSCTPSCSHRCTSLPISKVVWCDHAWLTLALSALAPRP